MPLEVRGKQGIFIADPDHACGAGVPGGKNVSLIDRIGDKSARIGVVGMGYVGLPLSLEFIEAGFPVSGIDVDASKVACMRDGVSHIGDVSDERLGAALATGRFTAHADYDEAGDLDIVIICVPTPLRKTREPDISYIVSALDSIAPRMRAGMLVILESTTYPGTTEEVLRPRLESGGLVAGKDFHLAFSPERVDPGNKTFDTHNTPKVVGGLTSACTEMAAALYGSAVDKVVSVSSTQSAEMVKLLENTFRAVNIGLVNEITLMCDRLKINVWEVIDAAATKPFGFMPFYPGPGIGGHCIPLDPHYLSWKLKTLNFYAKFIDMASEINSNMPLYVVGKVTDMLNEQQRAVRGSRLLVLGVTYKADTGDVRESPALDLIRLLEERGGLVDYSDPYVPELRTDGTVKRSVDLSAKNLAEYHCAVIVTNHKQVNYQAVLDNSRAVFDSRNATRGMQAGKCHLQLL
jgi:UDP-N-acetyl-D-glucosamine dehydrogenase